MVQYIHSNFECVSCVVIIEFFKAKDLVFMMCLNACLMKQVLIRNMLVVCKKPICFAKEIREKWLIKANFATGMCSIVKVECNLPIHSESPIM